MTCGVVMMMHYYRVCVVFVLCVLMRVVVCLPSTQPPVAYQGKFWQITDIHWDQQYSEDGNPGMMCHKKYSYEFRGHLSIWGNYFCDSPWPLVKSSIEAMVQIEAHPDFVLWTGDNAPHVDDPKPNYSTIFSTLNNITLELRTAFHPSVPILPVLGNHDAYPKDDYPVAGIQFYGKYLTEGNWQLLLPVEAQEEFENGGYYSYKLSSGITILVVNTNLYYAYNTLGINAPDPCGQFEWLRSKLQTARTEKYKVIVSAHAPPGYFERLAIEPFFNNSYNEDYVDLLNEFGDVILAQIYGHEHTDSFKLFTGKQGEVESVAFVAPSVTPWHPPITGGTAVNPSLRLYSYTTSEILDYYQYHFNLSKEASLPGDVINNTSNLIFSTEIPKWELLYQARETYGLSSLNTINMVSLFKQLESNDTLFQKYYLFNSAGYNNGLCDSSCKRSHICAIGHLKIPDVVECMNNTSSNPPPVLVHVPLSKDKYNFHKSCAPKVIIVLVALSMIMTVVLAVMLAIMLLHVVLKRGRLVRNETNFPILDLSKHRQNYRKLPYRNFH